MSLIESLMNNAHQDTQLLIRHDQLGDEFSTMRAVDFTMKAVSEPAAIAVSEFINDHQFGRASVEPSGDGYRIQVLIEMPTTQNLICSVSGFMACLAELFKVEYDGWGCVLQLRR